ncbi:hypothetical protein BDF14DRAFT_1442549 [Spinellus fusiger]|nr:hypothetical protein BDF14DRAFT_1442549 [Spinellus fusiger]
MMLFLLAQPLSTLVPECYGVYSIVKVLELLATIETLHEPSNTVVHVSEYLVGDSTGTLVFQTSTKWEPEDVIQFTNASTQLMEGYLRVVGSAVKCNTTDTFLVSIENNFSLVKYVRKVINIKGDEFSVE